MSTVVHYHTSQEEAEETVRELLAAGHEAIALQADITQEADVERMIETEYSDLAVSTSW